MANGSQLSATDKRRRGGLTSRRAKYRPPRQTTPIRLLRSTKHVHDSLESPVCVKQEGNTTPAATLASGAYGGPRGSPVCLLACPEQPGTGAAACRFAKQSTRDERCGERRALSSKRRSAVSRINGAMISALLAYAASEKAGGGIKSDPWRSCSTAARHPVQTPRQDGRQRHQHRDKTCFATQGRAAKHREQQT